MSTVPALISATPSSGIIVFPWSGSYYTSSVCGGAGIPVSLACAAMHMVWSFCWHSSGIHLNSTYKVDIDLIDIRLSSLSPPSVVESLSITVSLQSLSKSRLFWCCVFNISFVDDLSALSPQWLAEYCHSLFT